MASLASAATCGSLDTSPAPPPVQPGVRRNSSGSATRRPLRSPLPPPPPPPPRDAAAAAAAAVATKGVGVCDRSSARHVGWASWDEHRLLMRIVFLFCSFFAMPNAYGQEVAAWGCSRHHHTIAVAVVMPLRGFVIMRVLPVLSIPRQTYDRPQTTIDPGIGGAAKKPRPLSLARETVHTARDRARGQGRSCCCCCCCYTASIPLGDMIYHTPCIQSTKHDGCHSNDMFSGSSR